MNCAPKCLFVTKQFKQWDKLFRSEADRFIQLYMTMHNTTVFFGILLREIQVLCTPHNKFHIRIRLFTVFIKLLQAVWRQTKRRQIWGYDSFLDSRNEFKITHLCPVSIMHSKSECQCNITYQPVKLAPPILSVLWYI